MSVSSQVTKMSKLAQILSTKLEQKDNIKGLDNIKTIVKKGVEGKLLTHEQNKTLAEFFIAILPEFENSSIQSKMLNEIKKRKVPNES